MEQSNKLCPERIDREGLMLECLREQCIAYSLLHPFNPFCKKFGVYFDNNVSRLHDTLAGTIKEKNETPYIHSARRDKIKEWDKEKNPMEKAIERMKNRDE